MTSQFMLQSHESNLTCAASHAAHVTKEFPVLPFATVEVKKFKNNIIRKKLPTVMFMLLKFDLLAVTMNLLEQ